MNHVKDEGIKWYWYLLFDVAVVAALVALFAALIAAYGIYQSVRPEKILSRTTPADHGLAYESFRVTTADGVPIAGWFVPHADPANRAVIIVLHGYPADKGDLVARAAFLAQDFNLLFIDFRYFGESGRSISTAGAREVDDLLAAVEEAKRRGMERIGVYGFSMGGSVALMALPRTDDIDAVVTEAAYAELRLMAEELYRYFGPLKKPFVWLTSVLAEKTLDIDIDRVSPAKAVEGSQVPILVIHSKDDRVIPFKNAELLKDALADDPNAEFHFPSGQAHGEASTEFAALVGGFFTKHLLQY